MFKFEFVCMYFIIIASVINFVISPPEHMPRIVGIITTGFPVIVLLGYFFGQFYRRNIKS